MTDQSYHAPPRGAANKRAIAAELDATYPGPWAAGLVRLCAPRPHTHRDHDGVERECATPGKRPIDTGWQREAAERYADAGGPEDGWVGRGAHINTIARHVASGGNVGLMPPSGIAALDADDAPAAAWLDTAAPEAPAQETARGLHALVRVAADPTNTVRVPIAEGAEVDVRGHRAQIVCAPSVHHTGAAYTWLRPLPADWGDLPECPVPLPERVAPREPRTNGSAADGESIAEGQRNATLTSLAGTMRRRGMDAEAIYAALAATNTARCAPPLPEAEVRAIAESVSRYAPASDSEGSEDDHLRARLRAMDDLEYHRERKGLAKAAGVGVTALDDVRKAARKAARAEAQARPAAEPWPEPVDGSRLAADIEASLRRFVVLGTHSYVLVVLWAIGTHAYAARALWPLLLARSPQPACGKSTLLDVLERIVARAFAAGNASLATLFRSAAAGPTQLLDELDRWLERDPEVVGFLCAGWQSGRPFVRCHPETLELQEFTCYSPKALALIGDVRDEALRSRCIVVEMRRALPGERPERFRAGRAHPDLAALQAQAARWAKDHADAIGAYEIAEADLPDLPARAADNAEALLAVAEALGGEWPQRCRDAVTAAPVEEPQDLGAMLLADLAELLDTLEPKAETVTTQRILDHLLALEDRPWPSVGRGGKPITPHWLRRRLGPFGVRPGRSSASGTRQRGYPVAPLREAISRYTPTLPDTPDQVSQVSKCPEEGPCDAARAPETPTSGHMDTMDTSPAGPGEGVSRAGEPDPEPPGAGAEPAPWDGGIEL